MKPIYLDHAATTPVDPLVVEAMLPYLHGENMLWANAASDHSAGLAVADVVEQSRQIVADSLGADAREITFTSGATEANNLALKGAVEFYQFSAIATSKTEHKSVLDVCAWLEKQGVTVHWLEPGHDGLISIAQLDELPADVGLLSIMWVNNETGVRQDIAAIAAWAKARKVKLHVDATQAVCREAVLVDDIDYLSLSAHKFYGPKGVGALYCRRQPRARLAVQMHGGGHERGHRSGTLATHQIVGLAAALQLCVRRRQEDIVHLQGLQQMFEDGLHMNVPHILINGHLEQRAPGITNVSFHGVNGEALRLHLEAFMISSGSACTSATAEPSYVLRSLGRSPELAEASLRFSIGRGNTGNDIERVLEAVIRSVAELRRQGGFVAP